MKRKNVYAVIFLLAAIVLAAGLLIPTVGNPSGVSSKVSATKTQYSGYINALHLFKGEYGYWPEFFDDQSEFDLGEHPNSEQFIQTMSGRDKDGERIKAYGNTRAIYFYDFSDSELRVSDSTGYWQIVDRMGNHRIILSIDHDDDGIIIVPDGRATKQIRAKATAYSLGSNGAVAIKLWE